MIKFVNFCKQLNADFAIFERLQNLGTFTDEEFKKRAVHRQDHPLYDEFITIVSNPVFSQEIVWSDFNYFGSQILDPEKAKQRLKKLET